ncbi:Reverse transcriptase RNA-dependent DNA polymerase [Arabidopsis thaliana x Arabidopsis arenosa]|uniref:Reverse transcriptase RNA-dependent DNA polymerase n=1 Tax=Arabidopsis thaliana x Arabidopsis arenosa TaxID=1240361 RepID=A0A8T2A7S3_9BRAS|nr:Reverse transcriptase RNA-dependent DNA polymerase [Arabidopsis thaliana x Arabidopsis arenosa]
MPLVHITPSHEKPFSWQVACGKRFATVKRHEANHGQDVAEYFGKIKVMWDDLDDYEPFIDCCCSSPTCPQRIKQQTRRDLEHIHQFLMGLDASRFGTTRTNILSRLNRDTDMTLDQVYSEVVAEERHLLIARSKEERIEAVCFAVKAGVNAIASVTRLSQGPCTHCVSPITRGRGRGRNSYRANNAQVAFEDEFSDMPDVSKETWAAIKGILKSEHSTSHGKLSGKRSCVEFLLDSGASHYMTGDDDLLVDTHDISQRPHFEDADWRRGSDSPESAPLDSSDKPLSTNEPVVVTSDDASDDVSVDNSTDSDTPLPVTTDSFDIGTEPLAVTMVDEPGTYMQAVQILEWRKAMRKEIDALEFNETWTLERLPHGVKALGSKWVYRLKFNLDGTFEQYKARLVALGNHQKEGVDFSKTFAPVAKLQTVRTILGVASVKHWELHQIDVHNAFLHGDLDEDIYMKPPPGSLPSDSSLVSHGPDGIFLCQRKYYLDIIEECGLSGARPVDTPLEQNHKSLVSTSEPFEAPDQYRRLVGRLVYLTHTRPELSYAVNNLAQFMQVPLIDHWEAAQRLVRYLKSSPGQGILLSFMAPLQVNAYCDSDYNSCPKTRTKLQIHVLPASLGPVVVLVPGPVQSPSSSSSPTSSLLADSPVNNAPHNQLGPSPAPYSAASDSSVWIGFCSFISLLTLLVVV